MMTIKRKNLISNTEFIRTCSDQSIHGPSLALMTHGLAMDRISISSLRGDLLLSRAQYLTFVFSLCQDKEDVVSASCVLRTFSEDPYDSPDSDEEQICVPTKKGPKGTFPSNSSVMLSCCYLVKTQIVELQHLKSKFVTIFMKLNVTYILTIFVRPHKVFIFVGSANIVNSYWKAAVQFCNVFCSTLDNVHIFVSICFENFLVMMSTMVAIVKFENFLNFFNYFVSAVILPSNDSRTIFQIFNFVMHFLCRYQNLINFIFEV